MKRLLFALAFCMPSLIWGQVRLDHPYFKTVFPIEADGELIDVITGHAAPFVYDFNKDGVQDLLVGEFGEVDYDGIASGQAHDYVQGRCRVYINHGSDKAPLYRDFTYLQEEGGQPMAVPVTCCISFVPRFADFNGDGIDDVISGSYSGEIFYWEGKGNGMFGKRRKLEDIAGKVINPTHSVSAEPVDWDADGDYDLLVSSRMSGTYLYENKGDKTEYAFSKPQRLKLQDGKFGWEPTHLFPYDWDRDGLFDLVAGTENGDIALYRNRGTKGRPEFFERESLWDNPEREERRKPEPVGGRIKVFVYDYDQDGKDDILVGDVSSITTYSREPSVKELRREAKWNRQIRSLSDEFHAQPGFDDIVRKTRTVRACPGYEAYEKKTSALYHKIGSQRRTYKTTGTHGYVWVFIGK